MRFSSVHSLHVLLISLIVLFLDLYSVRDLFFLNVKGELAFNNPYRVLKLRALQLIEF